MNILKLTHEEDIAFLKVLRELVPFTVLGTCGDRGFYLLNAVRSNLKWTSLKNGFVFLEVTDEELQNIVKYFSENPKEIEFYQSLWGKILSLNERRKILGENILKLTDDQLKVLYALFESCEVKSFERKLEEPKSIIFKFLWDKILNLEGGGKNE